MKKLYFSVLLLIAILCKKDLPAQGLQDLSKGYQILSVFYNVPDNDQKNFDTVNFRYGWTSRAPYVIAVQFTNAGYADKKLKFAVKDTTSGQFVILDPVHNVFFGTETLKANSDGAIWTGPVDSLKDSFALRIWDSDGDAVDQEPISILNEWTQKPRNIPTITSRTAIPSPATPSTPARIPAVAQNIPAAIEDAKAVTIMGTAAPNLNCIYLAIGDSYTGGEGASSPARNFAQLSYETLKNCYPGIEFILDGNVGAEPWGWVIAMPSRLEEHAKKSGLPIGYMLFQTGPSCFFNVNHVDGDDHNEDDRCKGASLSQGVSYSYHYQKRMEEIIGEIYAANPNVNLVVLGIPDSSGGTSLFAPPAVYEAYRQRLFELKAKYPKMRIADIYRAMKGHSEYFKHYGGIDHPNDLGQGVIAKCILEQFKNWPYQPLQPKN